MSPISDKSNDSHRVLPGLEERSRAVRTARSGIGLDLQAPGGIVRGRRGNIAVETALIIPVLLILLYGTFDFGRYLLVLASVHRATASLAEVVIDEPLDPAIGGDTVWGAVERSKESWARLIDMMTDNDGDVSGIGIDAIWHSTDPRSGGGGIPRSTQAGEACDGLFSPDSRLLSAKTNENYAKPVYLAVRVCYRYQQPHPTLSTFVLPEWMESRFIAIRKDLKK